MAASLSLPRGPESGGLPSARAAGSLPPSRSGEPVQALPGPPRSLYVALRGAGGAMRVRRDGKVLWQTTEPVFTTSSSRLLPAEWRWRRWSKTEIQLEPARGRRHRPLEHRLAGQAAAPARFRQRRRDCPFLRTGGGHGTWTRYEHHVAYFRTDAGRAPRAGPPRVIWASRSSLPGAFDGSHLVALDQEPRSGRMALRLLDAGGAKVAR